MSGLNYFLVKSDQVLGVNVTDEHGNEIGKIEEIVLDKFSGETRYVVLSFGGVLGLGDKLFAIPWRALSYDKGRDRFAVNGNIKDFKQAPGFDKDHWPEFDSEQWQSICDYYDVVNPDKE